MTFVEPYLEGWELKERLSVFDRTFNIRESPHTHPHTHTHTQHKHTRTHTGRFVFNTPYTKGGKAHGEIDEQCMCKTILYTKDTFPYVKKRSKVINVEKVGWSH